MAMTNDVRVRRPTMDQRAARRDRREEGILEYKYCTYCSGEWRGATDCGQRDEDKAGICGDVNILRGALIFLRTFSNNLKGGEAPNFSRSALLYFTN